MTTHRYKVRWIIAAGTLALALTSASHATPAKPAAPDAVQLAQANQRDPRPLEPRYEPVPPQPRSSYNDEYIFAATKGVAHSTMIPAAKVSLYPLTVILDIVILPFAVIGGFF